MGLQWWVKQSAPLGLVGNKKKLELYCILCNSHLPEAIFLRRGLLPTVWHETFRPAASRLAQTQKSPASRLAADLKISQNFIKSHLKICLISQDFSQQLMACMPHPLTNLEVKVTDFEILC